MKSKSKHGWRWIAVGGLVVLLFFCGIWALRSHGVTVSHRRAVAAKAKSPHPGPLPSNARGGTNQAPARPAAREVSEGWEKWPCLGLEDKVVQP
jgi:hypothetical protein